MLKKWYLQFYICANCGAEKLRGLGNTGGQSLGSPTETTGYPYNSAALLHSLWLSHKQRNVAVTRCVESTKLLYGGPG